MKKFMDDNFLLLNDTAIKLYHKYAKKVPIYDYHCHLNPKEIWEDKKYKNMTEVWLYADHYKWRAMRSNGIGEEYITGDKSDYEKFMAWATTISNCIGNPLYHWTHLELKRYFGIDEVLNEDTADFIWNKCNEILKEDGFSARALIERSNVKMIGTTDEPTDSLKYHKMIKKEGKIGAKVLPTFRPDKGLEIRKEGFKEWIEKLSKSSNRTIETYSDLLDALAERINYFHEHGCRISDHGMDYVPYEEAAIDEINLIFKKALNNKSISDLEEEKYKTYTLIYLGQMYASLNWTMQFHIGTMRNNNTRMFEKIGGDGGFDSINDHSIARPLSRLLDSLEKKGKLPKTILYALNPSYNYIIGSMIGNFQGGMPSKVQFGTSWWFNDHKEGIIRQITDLANLGLLSRFVGMLTDSRSFLSYTRHEYFRRILCNIVGEWAENGEVPNDIEFLGSLIENICYYNAKNYFQIKL